MTRSLRSPLRRPFALEQFLGEWEFKAEHHLTASDAQSRTARDLLERASDADREAFEACWLGYTETRGAPDLLEAIAATYETIEPSQVLCFAGAEEGIYVAMRVLLGPDDHAVVVTPNYQAAETIPLSIGAVTGVPLEEKDNWSLDIDRVADAVGPQTKLVSINFPHNPTGKVLERDRLSALVDLCRARGLWLFSDEVYRGVEQDPARRLPHVADLYERGLSLGVMSKAYGLPGLRIGWIACRDPALLDELVGYKHYLSICNSSPSERLAVIALRQGARILEENRRLIGENIAAAEALFDRFEDRFRWVRPDGGCVGFVRYGGPEGVETFCRSLLEEASVLLLPASVYRSDLTPVPDTYFRLGVGRRATVAGLDAVERWLAQR